MVLPEAIKSNSGKMSTMHCENKKTPQCDAFLYSINLLEELPLFFLVLAKELCEKVSTSSFLDLYQQL
jgi:hypothetical protein